MTRQTIDVPGAKRLILTLAVASSVSLWAVFSRIEAQPPDTSNQPDSGATDAPSTDTQAPPVFTLPPIPTLVPPVTVVNVPGGSSFVANPAVPAMPQDTPAPTVVIPAVPLPANAPSGGLNGGPSGLAVPKSKPPKPSGGGGGSTGHTGSSH